MAEISEFKDPSEIIDVNEPDVIDEEEMAFEQIRLAKADDTATFAIKEKRKANYRQIMGIRPHAVKQLPWPGASNLHIPLTDKIIGRKKPDLAALTFGVSPPVVFERSTIATPVEAQIKREQIMDWLLRVAIKNFTRESILNDHSILVDGVGVFKITWNFKTRKYIKDIRIEDLPPEVAMAIDVEDDEVAVTGLMADVLQISATNKKNREEVLSKLEEIRSQEEGVVKFKLEELWQNAPTVTNVSLTNIILPDDTEDIADARRITHRFFVTLNDLRIKERRDVYKNVDEVETFLVNKRNQEEEDDPASVDKSNREEIQPSKGENAVIEIWEQYYWHDLDGDGIEEKVVDVVHPDSGVVLKSPKLLPYDHGQWPFVQRQTELYDRGFWSPRGVPEKIRAFQDETNDQHNAKLDRMLIANSPMFFARMGKGITGESMRFTPGGVVFVKNIGDIVPVQVPNLDFSFERAENIERANAEEYAGAVDFGITSLANPGERRTATEVSLVESTIEKAFSLDAIIYQIGSLQLFKQIWALWNQYGPSEVEIRVLGIDDPVKITREEIQGEFEMSVKGNAFNSSRVLQKQLAERRFALLGGDATGMVNRFELMKDLISKDDPKLVNLILNSGASVQRDQQERQALENLMIINGDQIDVRPADNDVEHLKVMEAFDAVPENAQKFTPDTRAVWESHKAQHGENIRRQQQLQEREIEKKSPGGFVPVESKFNPTGQEVP